MKKIIAGLAIIIAGNYLFSQNNPYAAPIYENTVNGIDVDQSISSMILNKKGGKDQDLAVMRITGYCSQDIGAADRRFDLLVFNVISCDKKTLSYLEQVTDDFSTDENEKNILIKIYIQVPHEIDPGHVIKHTSINTPVSLIIQIYPPYDKGGWDYKNQVMMFQLNKDINIPYKDDYSETDYDHFYDGV